MFKFTNFWVRRSKPVLKLLPQSGDRSGFSLQMQVLQVRWAYASSSRTDAGNQHGIIFTE